MVDYFNEGLGKMIASHVFERVFSELYLDFINEGGDPSNDKGKPVVVKCFMQAMNAYANIVAGWKYFDDEGNPLSDKSENEKTEEINNI